MYFIIQTFLRFSLLIFVSLIGFSLFALHAQDTPIETNETLHVSEENGLNYTDAAILGVVEGLTEYLPVSSTGHLILTDYFMDDSEERESDHGGRAAINAYLIVIQGGAILAVLFIYWKKIFIIFLGLIGKNPKGLALGLKILVAFIPAALIGPFLNDLIESNLFNPFSVCVALASGAVLMIWVELLRAKKSREASMEVEGLSMLQMEDMSYRASFFIGVMQCFAMWPGMSRSMVTIIGGYFVGLEAKAAAEFSFLLGLLTLSAASCYSMLDSWDVMIDYIKPGPAIFGVVVATVVAFAAVKWFVKFLAKHGLIVFAIYRLLLAGAILCLFGV